MARIPRFVLEVSDNAGRLLEAFDVPMEGAALFINPLFKVLLGDESGRLREPWYHLKLRKLTDKPRITPTIYPTPSRASTNPPIIIIPDPADPVQAINVTLYDLERPLYTADYSTVDVFGPLLSYLIQSRIKTGRYAAAAGPFRLLIVPQFKGGDMHIFELVPHTMLLEGVFPLPVPRPPGPRTTFQLVTQHNYETRSLETWRDLQTTNLALGGRHRLIWRATAFRALTLTQAVSASVETGGYLLGQVYRLGDAHDTLLVDIQKVLVAKGTLANAALLVFTSESWSGLRRLLSSNLAGLRLLGWWHTHLFPATEDFGLSGLDESLHRQFFPHPWHFTALLNVSPEQGRVLRCYQPNNDSTLTECAFSVAADDDSEKIPMNG